MTAGTFLLLLIGFGIAVAIVLLAMPLPAQPDHLQVTQAGRHLHYKFRMLGALPGKTRAEIVAAVGEPTSISVAAAGRTLLQWQATGCHMALLFEGDVCLGITHEYLANS